MEIEYEYDKGADAPKRCTTCQYGEFAGFEVICKDRWDFLPPEAPACSRWVCKWAKTEKEQEVISGSQ